MNHSEKTAMSDRNKYVKAMIASAIAAAGIGAVAKNIRERKARAEANNVSISKNTIVIPVLKSRFMEGLPTPEELKKSRGEGELATDAGSPDQLTAQAQQASLTPEEIAAKKREIVGGRKFDFFGKRAEKASDGEKKDEGSKSDSGNDDNDKGGRILFRDQNGKFVSPSDPVAVEAVEKSAEGEGYDWASGLYNMVFHPIDTAGVMFNAAKDKPVLMTAGAVGSIILAAKISDSINKMRRERSKNRLDKARNQYVSLLEGGDSEKAAQASNDPRVPAGALIGGAFVVPLALTALVTNRIIENRKNEKKREKEMSDSYPDEPIILYKTSEDKEIRISPETALVAMLVKRAMIESAEAYENGIVKKADFDWAHPIDSATEGLASMYYGNKAPVGIENEAMRNAADTAIGYFDKPENEELYLGMMKDIESKKFDDAKAKFKQMIPEDVQKQHSSMFLNRGFIPSLAGYDKFHNSVVGHYNDPRFKAFAADKKSRIDNYLTFGGALKQGGMLHNILSWFMNTLGLGNGVFNAKIRNQLNGFAGQGDMSNAGSQTQDQLGGAQGMKGNVTITR